MWTTKALIKLHRCMQADESLLGAVRRYFFTLRHIMLWLLEALHRCVYVNEHHNLCFHGEKRKFSQTALLFETYLQSKYFGMEYSSTQILC